MNYQQRNRALFEGIREPCEKTGGNRNVAQIRAVGINSNLVINV
jgi:hypothetical protein